jgi:hypothetical protein
LVGKTKKWSFFKIPKRQSFPLPGSDAMAPHSKIFPKCKERLFGNPFHIGKAANSAISRLRPAIIKFAPQLRASIKGSIPT